MACATGGGTRWAALMPTPCARLCSSEAAGPPRRRGAQACPQSACLAPQRKRVRVSVATERAPGRRREGAASCERKQSEPPTQGSAPRPASHGVCPQTATAPMWQPPAGLAARTRQAAALQSEHKLLLARGGCESRLQQRDGDLRLGCTPVVGKHEGQVAAVAAAAAVASPRLRRPRSSLRGVRRLVYRRRRSLCGCHGCTDTTCAQRPLRGDRVFFQCGSPEKRPSLERLLLRHLPRKQHDGPDRRRRRRCGVPPVPGRERCVSPPYDNTAGRATHTQPRRVNSAPPDLVHVQGLVDPQLSEPYSVFTYRYFLTAWPHLCFMVRPCASPNTQNTSHEADTAVATCRSVTHSVWH